jgi:hypothetical protein
VVPTGLRQINPQYISAFDALFAFYHEWIRLLTRFTFCINPRWAQMDGTLIGKTRMPGVVGGVA